LTKIFKAMVLVHFAEGFEEIEAISVVDVLRRAGIETRMVSVTGSLPVTGSHGITVNTDVLFHEALYDDAQMLVLPGGLPGAHNLFAHKGLVDKLLQFSQLGKPLAAICAAPYILGELGILAGEKATCYPGFEKHLKGAEVVTEQAVISGNIITGRGAGPAIGFALKIVEYLQGKSLADALKLKMLVA
jgi:protein deglycase